VLPWIKPQLPTATLSVKCLGHAVELIDKNNTTH